MVRRIVNEILGVKRLKQESNEKIRKLSAKVYFQFNLKFSELNYKKFMEDSYENLNFHVEM